MKSNVSPNARPGIAEANVSVVPLTEVIADEPRMFCPVLAKTRTTSAVVTPFAGEVAGKAHDGCAARAGGATKQADSGHHAAISRACQLCAGVGLVPGAQGAAGSIKSGLA